MISVEFRSLGTGTCGCADFNGSGGPDVGDVPGFVAKLLAGGCP